MNLNEMRDEAYTTSRSKGWYEEGRRSVPTYLVLIHSEISEALEAWRASGDEGIRTIETMVSDNLRERGAAYAHGVKPEGVASELSDVVIRVGDMAGAFDRIDLDVAFHGAPVYEGVTFGNLSERLAYLHTTVADALTHWDAGGAESATRHPLALANGLGAILKATFRIADDFKIDLDRAVHAKMAFNKTRPHRHGGKKV